MGHPEHELLFVATQVARASGMKSAKNSAQSFIKYGQRSDALIGIKAQELLSLKVHDSCTLTETDVRAALPYPRWRDTWLLPESAVYQMLLRGNSPASEPFRKWVTEEVLPTICKTGSYDASKSEHDEWCR